MNLKEIAESLMDFVKQNECKTQGGVCYPASDWAYTPDMQKVSTWKLLMAQGRPGNITVSQLGRAAAAFSPGGFRGRRVQIPAADVGKVKAKIRGAYAKLGVKKEQMPDSIKEVPALSIWKEGGEYRWLAAYSNNFRDNDQPPEIISAQSHKEFDEALEKGEWPMPELWLWHVPYPVGETRYHAFDKDTGFPVAGGAFYKGMEWAAEGVIKAGWNGVSHSMPRAEIRRDKEDDSIIIRHRTKEISMLPTWAAANKLAFNLVTKESEEMADKGLPPEKRAEFLEAFPEEKVAQIEEALGKKSQEAKDAGVESKEEGKPDEAEVKTEETPADEMPLTRKELFEALALIVDEVKELKTEVSALKEEATKEEEPEDLVAMLQKHRAIGQEETRVDKRTKEAKDVPVETGGQYHPIPIIDQIMKSNRGEAVQ